jgi:hypothetical protein
MSVCWAINCKDEAISYVTIAGMPLLILCQGHVDKLATGTAVRIDGKSGSLIIWGVLVDRAAPEPPPSMG